MTPYLNRSVVWARPVPGGVEVLCDCATITEIQIDSGTPEQESAFTCEGYLSVHWFTLTATTPGSSA